MKIEAKQRLMAAAGFEPSEIDIKFCMKRVDIVNEVVANAKKTLKSCKQVLGFACYEMYFPSNSSYAEAEDVYKTSIMQGWVDLELWIPPDTPEIPANVENLAKKLTFGSAKVKSCTRKGRKLSLSVA